MRYVIQVLMCWVLRRIVAQFLFAAVPAVAARVGLLEQVPVRDAVAAAAQDALVAAVEADSSLVGWWFGPASLLCLTTSSLRQACP